MGGHETTTLASESVNTYSFFLISFGFWCVKSIKNFEAYHCISYVYKNYNQGQDSTVSHWDCSLVIIIYFMKYWIYDFHIQSSIMGSLFNQNIGLLNIMFGKKKKKKPERNKIQVMKKMVGPYYFVFLLFFFFFFF